MFRPNIFPFACSVAVAVAVKQPRLPVSQGWFKAQPQLIICGAGNTSAGEREWLWVSLTQPTSVGSRSGPNGGHVLYLRRMYLMWTVVTSVLVCSCCAIWCFGQPDFDYCSLSNISRVSYRFLSTK